MASASELIFSGILIGFFEIILVVAEFCIIFPSMVQYNVGGGLPLAEQLSLVFV